MILNHDSLALIWFALLGVLLIGYTILDGFDLGVGILHPIARSDEERRIMMNAIGPLWDGNEVWLVTFGGALFAAFPVAYATVFSAFYMPFMLLLTALIFRAVSLEFRSKVRSRIWRGLWDRGFFASSLLVAFLFGLVGGHTMLGLPVNQDLSVHMTAPDFIRPYPIAVGLLTVFLFAMHGAIFLFLKTEGDLQRRIERWVWRTFGVFLVAYILLTMYTLVEVPHVTRNFREHGWLWVVPLLNVLAIANIPRAMYLRRPFYAFVSSGATIAALAFLFAAAIYPHLVPGTIDPAWSVSIYNARSSETTLRIMLLIAIIGIPCVLTYTVLVYWIFRGKVRLDEHSY